MLNNPALPMGYFGMGPVVASALRSSPTSTKSAASPSSGSPGRGRRKRHKVHEDVALEKPSAACVISPRRVAEGRAAAADRRSDERTLCDLLRGTVARMVESHEVWITDWADAKMVPLSAGSFDLDDYIDYLVEFIRFIGEGTHVMAVCQPSVPAFAAPRSWAPRTTPAARPR